MHHGTCKVCGKYGLIDSCRYCKTCYPYDNSTDRYKASLDANKCHHTYPDPVTGWCGCGVYVRKAVEG